MTALALVAATSVLTLGVLLGWVLWLWHRERVERDRWLGSEVRALRNGVGK